MHMHHRHVAVRVCAISILWNFYTNPCHPSKNYDLKQQGDGAGETSRNDKLRVAGHGLGNTQICARTVRYGSRLVADTNQLVPRESSRTKITSSWNGPIWAEV